MKKGWLSEAEYDRVYGEVPRLCVDLVVKNHKGILLAWRGIEPHKHTWHLPGGRVRFRETLAKAAVRIAREETGLKIKPGKVLGTMEFLHEIQRGRPRHSVSVVLEASLLGGRLKSGNGNGGLKFFKKFPGRALDIHARFLKKLPKTAEKPVVR